MLAKHCYDHEDVAACRTRMDRHLQAWRELMADGPPGLAAFEPVFFNRLVIELAFCFIDWPMGAAPDPFTEVRVLATSLTCDGRVAVDRTIRWCPEQTVLGYRAGEPIAVREAEFLALERAFLRELEGRLG